MNFQKLEQPSEIDVDYTSEERASEADSSISLTAESKQTVAESSDTEFEHVLAELKRSSRRHGWFSLVATILGGMLGIVVGTGVLVVLATLIMEGKLPHLVFDFSLTTLRFGSMPGSKGAPSTSTLSGITPLCLLVTTAVFAALTKRERTRLISELSHYDDVRAVGPFIEALYLRNKVAGMQAARMLKLLLPKMKPENKDLLSKEQRNQMNLYLGRSASALMPDDNELSLAILNAYWNIGDESEVPTVRRVAQGKCRVGKDSEVRLAAQAYLDEVARRQEKSTEAHTLLRSAESVGDMQNSLLRPAEGTQQSDPDLLLRPTNE